MTSSLNDKDLLMRMFDAAVIYLNRHVDAINSLNVFPVPDGDTGTNMYKTLLGTKERISKENPSTIVELAALMKLGTLYEGRGNSGIILSQVFNGIHEGISGSSDITTFSLVQSLANASDRAYSSVGNPVEGTMLTVLREVAKEASLQGESGATICEAFDALVETAYVSVNRTPDQLPILKEGGVVDSGGYGIEIILRGMSLGLSGDDPETAALHLRYPEGQGIKQILRKHHEDEALYGYCTQFVLTSLGSSREDQIDLFNDLGNSVVIVGDVDVFRVHIHAEDPGNIITNAVHYGSISQVSIEDMESQAKTVLDSNSALEAPISYKKTDTDDSQEFTALVQIASGAGLEKLLFDAGVTAIIGGGDGMNPSIGEIVETIDSLPNLSVVLMPNNKNILAAAIKAADLSKNDVKVVPTHSVTQGLECAFEFDPNTSAEENREYLSNLLADIKTCFIFQSARSVVLNGVKIRKNQSVAMMDKKLISSANHALDLLDPAVRSIASDDGDQVLVLAGGKFIDTDLDVVKESLKSSFGSLEGFPIEVHWGGQPHYDFIISSCSG